MNKDPVIRILKKDSHVSLPGYESEGAAGMDLCAFLGEAVAIPPLGRAVIPTGLMLEIPAGYEVQVRPRSGLAAKFGITVLNSPGTIDSDYRGELQIILINLGSESFTVHNSDRVAQMIIAPVSRGIIEEALSLEETKRGSGGFGSTGI
jgi:dUTP pyrophosphatase